MSRSVTGLPDNDMDYATVSGNAGSTYRAPALSAAEMARRKAAGEAALARMAAVVATDQPLNRCPHGVNLDKADCGRCVDPDIDRASIERDIYDQLSPGGKQILQAMLSRLQATQDELKGVALAARFDRRG